jgi:hypothetical protein
MKAPDPLRQSSIARFDACALSLLLSEQSPVRQPSDLAARGTLFHRWVARAIAQMRERGWTSYPVEMGLELLLEVLAQRDVPDHEVVHLPMRELRWLRVVVTRWCEGGAFNAQRVVAIEERINGVVYVPDGNGGMYERIVTGQPDVLVADPPNGMICIDWKSGWAPPAKEVERVNGNQDQDQTLSDQGYAQQVIYGLLVLQTYPAVEKVTLREAYLMYGEYREATIERWQMERVTDILGAVIAQIDAAFEAGPESKRWIPTAGTHCAMCPAPRKCPLTEWLGTPTTVEEAQLVAREWIVAAEVRKERLPLLKGWYDANGPLPIEHAKGRREVGWTPNKSGDGRSFKLYEPEDAPDSPWDERLLQAMAKP